MQIEGSIEKVRFYNEQNGYTVASMYISTKEKQKIKDASFIGNSLTIVGTFDRKVIEDEEYILTGDFTTNKSYGLQFKFISFTRKQFDSTLGLINFLSSDLFPGVGLSAAKEVVNYLGIDAVDKIKNDKTVLDKIPITLKQKETIIEVLLKDKGNEEVLIFLLNHGITLSTAQKIINAFDNHDIIKEISENPYILIDKIDRFGFKKADLLAFSLGIKPNDKCRVEALINYSLEEIIYSNGNSYVINNELYEYVLHKIDGGISLDVFNDTLNKLNDHKKIYIDNNNRIFIYDLYQDEVSLGTNILKRIKNNKCPYNKENIDKAIAQVINDASFSYNNEQLTAIKEAFNHNISIITGGPGTGKTTIIHAIIKMYNILNKDNNKLLSKIALLAPTGRAAKRLNETTLLPASTIHKYLGYGTERQFLYGEYNKTDSRLVIIDEASMMDTSLASHLFKALPLDAIIIIVGDVDQLPSVGPGQVLYDLIETNLINTIRLTKIHRQAEDSSIIKLSRYINERRLPSDILEKLNDRSFISCSENAVSTKLVDVYLKALDKGYDIQDIQILIPMYKGINGINEINHLIQEKVNPVSKTHDEVNINGKKLRINDKVIQLVNRADKGVMNGDIGYITSINYENNKFSNLKVAFDNLKVEYETEDLSDITLAYAISIHKAQGSEFDIVIMPLDMNYYVMLKKKLLYTAITRTKNILIMIGNVRALSYGIMRTENNRNTLLQELLIQNQKTKSIKDILKTLDEENINMLGEEEIEI